MNLEKFYRHNPDNTVLYRNFIDGLIRAVWAKENFEFENIHSSFEKYIKFRLETIMNKDSSPFGLAYSEHNDDLIKIVEEGELEKDVDLKKVFDHNLTLRHTLTFEKEKETTMSVKTLLELLERAGLVEGNED